MGPTIDNPITRPWAWWRLAEQVCGRLTSPRIDVAAADRAVEALIRDSWMWSCGQSFASKVQAAWQVSVCRTFVRWLTSHWR